MSSSSNIIKEERQDEAEIRELAAKLVEANKSKIASTMARQPATPMNIVGYFTKKHERRSSSQSLSPEDRKTSDDDSLKGRFGWVQLGKCYIPYIFRTGEKYCAVRMVEMKLLNKYLNHLHQDIYSCTCIRSYYITEGESRLLNEINIKHCDNQFGRDLFTTRDLIVRLSDANEFYNFLDVCYSKLIQGSCNPKDRCGFIRINKESVVPYTVKNDSKYVPLFYFEGETENLHLKADQLEGWDLSYLKFCCKVQGIRNELFAHDSCAVISLNAIKSYFPPGTGFEDYWPSKVVESQLLLNGKNSSAVGQWTRQPPTPPIAQKCTAAVKGVPHIPQHHHSTSVHNQPVQAMYSGVGVGYAGLVGGQPTFQNVSASPSPGQAVRMAQSPARASYQSPSPASPRPAQPQRHQYYPPPPLTQAPPPPPPLIRSANQVAPSTGTATTYSSASAPGTVTGTVTGTSAAGTGTSTTAAQNVMMIQDLNGMTQPVNSYASVAAAAAARSNVSMSPRYPPPLIPVRSVNGSQTPRYHTYPNPNSAQDAVDLSASHISRSQIRNNVATDDQSHMNMPNGRTCDLGKKLTPIADTQTSGSHIPYKIQKALVEGKMIPCINMKPYVWTELLVTLPDIVQHFFNAVPLSSCRRVMDVLGIELYRGNRQQMQILQESGKCETVNDNLALVQVLDVIKYMPQMKYMLGSLLNEPLSKRQRTS